jgi:hypothetical protein
MSENPYNPLQPISDPTLFYGHEDTIAFLQLHLSGRVHQKALVIVGAPGIGKSSLLAQVSLVVDERYPSVNIDLSNLELKGPVALIATIVDKTRAMMTAIQASTYRLPPFPDPTDPGVDLLEWLEKEYLDVVFAAIRRQRHFVLMLDNVHLLFDAIDAGDLPATFITYLQGLLERHEQFDLVATLDITYEERALQMSPFDDANLYARLSLLPLEVARRIVTEPTGGVYQFTPAALDKVLRLAGGHPFHLHSLCRLIYRRWEEAPYITTIEVEDVEAIYPAALELAGQTVDGLAAHLRPNEEAVLLAMLALRKQEGAHPIHPDQIEDHLSKTPYPLNTLQIAAALRGLEYWGLLQSNQYGRYLFPAGIHADWLTRQREQQKAETVARSHRPFALTSLLAVVAVLAAVGLGAWVMRQLDSDNERALRANGLPTVTLIVPTNTPLPPTPRSPFHFGG